MMLSYFGVKQNERVILVDGPNLVNKKFKRSRAQYRLHLRGELAWQVPECIETEIMDPMQLQLDCKKKFWRAYKYITVYVVNLMIVQK